MTSNLYKIDDVLLRGGVAIGAFALLAFSAATANFVENGSLKLSTLVSLALLLSCPLVMLTVGWQIRKREKQLVKLWQLVESQGHVPVQQLLDMSSFSRKQLAAAVDSINHRGNAALAWDQENTIIRDASVKQHKMTHSEQCQSCGGNVNIEVNTSQSDYTCPYCGAGLDCRRINVILDKLQLREGRKQQSISLPPGEKVNLSLFIVLLVVFWPAAVFYAIKVYNKRNSGKSWSSSRQTTFKRVSHSTIRTNKFEESPAVFVTTTTTTSKSINRATGSGR